MSIFIAVPCYGGQIHAEFAQSLLKLVSELKKKRNRTYCRILNF